MFTTLSHFLVAIAHALQVIGASIEDNIWMLTELDDRIEQALDILGNVALFVVCAIAWAVTEVSQTRITTGDMQPIDDDERLDFADDDFAKLAQFNQRFSIS